jgi:Subtilase family
MKHTSTKWLLAAVSAAALAALVASLSPHARAQQSPDIADTALEQMSEIAAIKAGFTPAQQKIEAGLVFAVKKANGDLAFTSVSDVPETIDPVSNVTVDIYGTVSQSLLDSIAAANGVVLTQSDTLGMIQASLPFSALETVAANDDVRSIQSAAQAVLNAGSITSQGYISHKANNVAAMGITGAGVTVGVLSDSASVARIAALVSTGDLPPGSHALPGQNSTGTDEGAAMMEIVHDVAPGADIIFATANGGVANFANNIIQLQAAGARVIVDDITYFNEGVFQDGPVAQAVTQVTNNGAIYFSSAANSGSLTFGTSGTWEGDFTPNGPTGAPISEPGTLHNFGTAGSPQNFDVLTAVSNFISLKWSDPLGASTNDYDLFILNSTGTTVKGFSVGAQTGTQDPYEFVRQGTNCGTASASGYCPTAGDRLVVVLFSGAPRALHVDTERGRLSIGTEGATFGHNAGASTVSTAATYWNSARTGTKPFTGAANPNEFFSSDGPRKIFFNPNGTPITLGNFLFSTNGGITLQKPDIAAADGSASKTPGFFPFFGTSAAAPHAAAIAALILSVQPAWTPAQVLNAITSTAVDSMAPGVDRDSGHGIVMAWPAVHEAVKSLED